MATFDTLDLEFMGVEQLIAAYAVELDDGWLLVEPGPASSVDDLDRQAAGCGLGPENLRGIFVTHVHLDHAGAAGTLARRSGCPVWVHPEGRRHLADPEAKLLPSAKRLYGDLMETLWGRIEAVPADQLRTVEDGETVRIGGVEVRGWHTPGHAKHHVCWQIGDAIATGDVAGVRFPGADHVLPPTPPPDIDVAAWRRSIRTVRSLAPARLLLAHYGAVDDVDRHLDELEGRMVRWWALARDAAAEEAGPEALAVRLLELDEVELTSAGVGPGATERYRRLCPMDANAAGLYRNAVAAG